MTKQTLLHPLFSGLPLSSFSQCTLLCLR